ncbi:ATP-grasp domain-containing protein [Mesorhizobium sp. M0018]|uniref:ATP-grasp domain-containing protein n=1 Tax=Mesorhizobium sp. M0018 TaxID=2956844 RepID=UPI00333BEBAA
MSLSVSFLFGGLSTEYDASISSLSNIISAYLSIAENERPFTIACMYHLSRDDGLVRIIDFHDQFTSADLRARISSPDVGSGHSIHVALDLIASRNQYVVNLLHGQFGEDGGIQTLAALWGLSGTFGDPHAASLTMNKFALSTVVCSLFPNDLVRMPKTTLVKADFIDDAIQFAKSVQGSIVVKPNSLGASLFAKRFRDPAVSESDIASLLRTIFRYDSAALIQEFIDGDEYSCGCLVSSSATIPLPVVRIETSEQFFGHHEKHYPGQADKHLVDCDNDIARRLQSIAVSISSTIPLYNMGRFDFMVSPDNQIYFLECNYIPGLMKNSIYPKMLIGHGMTVIDLISWTSSKSSQFRRKDHHLSFDTYD